MTPEELEKLKKLRPDILEYLRTYYPSQDIERLTKCFMPGVSEPPEPIAHLFRELKREKGLPEDLPILVVPNSAKRKDTKAFYSFWDSRINTVFIYEYNFLALLDDTTAGDHARCVLDHELNHARDDYNGRSNKIWQSSVNLTAPAIRPAMSRRQLLKTAVRGAAQGLGASALYTILFAPRDQLANAFKTFVPGVSVLGAIAEYFDDYVRHSKEWAAQAPKEWKKKVIKINNLMQEISADEATTRSIGTICMLELHLDEVMPDIKQKLGYEGYTKALELKREYLLAFCAERKLNLPPKIEAFIARLSLARDVLGEAFATDRYPEPSDRLEYIYRLVEHQSPYYMEMQNAAAKERWRKMMSAGAGQNQDPTPTR